MMCFGILPNEIILEIARNVEEDHLRKFALYSRLLNRPVASLLYEDVEVETDLGLSRLLRLIPRKPELGTYVNTLAVTKFGGDVNKEEDGDIAAELRVEQQGDVAYTFEDSDRCYTAITKIALLMKREWSSLLWSRKGTGTPPWHFCFSSF
ncbi:hypothetical protein ACEPPN_013650 [Leptodophora sp. 'Broadleaf-Isolate-01']